MEVKAITVDLSQPNFMSTIPPVVQMLEVGLLINNVGFGLVGNRSGIGLLPLA